MRPPPLSLLFLSPLLVASTPTLARVQQPAGSYSWSWVWLLIIASLLIFALAVWSYFRLKHPSRHLGP